MIEVENLNVIFGTDTERNHAVKDVSFTVSANSSFGIVGESGSGKSTVLACICGLLQNWTGNISIGSEKVLDKKRTPEFYSKVQMVFQDPYGSLHPRQTVDRALKEPLLIHKMDKINERVEKVLSEVGLGSSFRFRYPHQLSGGQRQRVAVARALILEPEIILLDEPTSALDVSVQDEVLNLLADVGVRRNLTYILVSHDLAVVSHMCDSVCVMNKGVVVEEVSKEQLQKGDVRDGYTCQLFLASKGYDRSVIDSFQEF